MEFDSTRHFLGSLCYREHDWNNTGFSLRRIKKHECLECRKIANKKSDEKNKEKRNKWRKEYRFQNIERIREKDRSPERKRKRQEYYQRNKEKILERVLQRAEGKKEEISAYKQKWYLQNKAKLRAINKAWYLQNKERARIFNQKRYAEKKDEINQKRRQDRKRLNEARRRYIATERGKEVTRRARQRREARKKGNHFTSVSLQEWQKRKEDFNNSCAYCGSGFRLEQDHFIPLSVGGPDCLGNLIPACKSCNSGKNNKDPYEWYSSQKCFSKSKWKRILKILGKTQETYNQMPLI